MVVKFRLLSLQNVSTSSSIADGLWGERWRLMEGAKKSTLEKQDAASGTTRGVGHFYYRPDSDEGKFRRRQLANYLYRQGLR